jgi:uncharacterized coiled-coil protein SlyX
VESGNMCKCEWEKAYRELENLYKNKQQVIDSLTEVLNVKDELLNHESAKVDMLAEKLEICKQGNYR